MTSTHWQSPLSTRYASAAMQELWSESHRIGQWRRVWLALAEAEQELGIAIPPDAIAGMRAHLDDADLAAAAVFEQRFRHDVMAHVHAFGEQAPSARPYLHLGATSAFVTDNADGLILRDSVRLILGRLLDAVAALRRFATTHRDTPCLAYTHFQPAQLTTVGKRATLWMQDFALDVESALHLLDCWRLRGCKGTTGTQASFLELFQGDGEQVRRLERLVLKKLGGDDTFAVTGQTYPRKFDAQVVDMLGGVAQSATKFGADLRLLQHEGEVLEPFETEQIGSSAMAYKRNPMRAERMGALARHVISLQASAREHRGESVARAHARRLGQSSPHVARGLPRDGCRPVARRQHQPRARGAGRRDRRTRGRADALHGHRAVADARCAGRRRSAAPARGDSSARDGDDRGSGRGRNQ